MNCHTQSSRPLLAETQRYDGYSVPDAFQSDYPSQWGFTRIGPDLARQAGKHSNLWHWRHLEHPQTMPEGEASIMPAFDHLHDQPLTIEEVLAACNLPADSPLRSAVKDAVNNQSAALAADLTTSGGPVMRKGHLTRDSRVLALIAYLQSLGRE